MVSCILPCMCVCGCQFTLRQIANTPVQRVGRGSTESLLYFLLLRYRDFVKLK